MVYQSSGSFCKGVFSCHSFYKMKRNRFSFVIVLIYSYLCASYGRKHRHNCRIGQTSHIERIRLRSSAKDAVRIAHFHPIQDVPGIFATGGERSEDYESLLNAARKAVDGQVNHVLLNIATDYDSRLLASDIKAYFEINADAVEVLIFKGKKQIFIDRDFTLSPQYHRLFRKRYEK